MIDVNRVNKEFGERYQTTIEELKKEHSQFSIRKAASVAIINAQNDFLINKVKDYNPNFNFEKLTKYQSDVYYTALIQQIYYVLMEFDFTLMTGFDAEHNSFTNIDILDKVAMSKISKETLLHGGLLYRGINGGGVYFKGVF